MSRTRNGTYELELKRVAEELRPRLSRQLRGHDRSALP